MLPPRPSPKGEGEMLLLPWEKAGMRVTNNNETLAVT